MLLPWGVEGGGEQQLPKRLHCVQQMLQRQDSPIGKHENCFSDYPTNIEPLYDPIVSAHFGILENCNL